MMEARLVFFNGAQLLEGPCWDAAHGALYFVAIRQNTIFRLEPDTGRMDAQIALPCRNVTSCCIGGRDMDTLYITTAKCAGQEEPLAGGLFAAALRQ